MYPTFRRRQTALFYTSLGGIGVVAALLAIGVVDLYVDHSTQWVLPALLATVSSSLLLWWLFIVRTRRASLWRGLLTGGVSTMSAIPLGIAVGVLLYGLPTDVTVWQVLYVIGSYGLNSVRIVAELMLSPLGWGLFLFGSFVGGLAVLTLQAGLLRIEEASRRAGGATPPPVSQVAVSAATTTDPPP